MSDKISNFRKNNTNNSGNSYIITSEGFLSDIEFIKAELRTEITYTQILRDAVRLKPKNAKSIMNKYKIVGFIWSPAKEEVLEKKWYIQKVSEWNYNKEDKPVMWSYRCVGRDIVSDLLYLNKKTNFNTDPKDMFDSEEEARIECIKRNEKIIDDLYAEIEKQNRSANNQRVKNVKN